MVIIWVSYEQRHQFFLFHLAPPKSSPRPRQRFIVVLTDCLREANPPLSTLKYFFARPPRSGVGSPTLDDTHPFSSILSRLVYTAPRHPTHPPPPTPLPPS